MKNAYDEILATALKRQHEPQRFAGDLLKAEISEKQARSVKYQLTIAKLPLAKDVDGFKFKGTPINESLVRDLAGGDFIAPFPPSRSPGGLGRVFHTRKAGQSALTADMRVAAGRSPWLASALRADQPNLLRPGWVGAGSWESRMDWAGPTITPRCAQRE